MEASGNRREREEISLEAIAVFQAHGGGCSDGDSHSGKRKKFS